MPIPAALLDDLAGALSLTDVLAAFSPWLLQSIAADRTSIALVADGGKDIDVWAMAGDKAIRVGSSIPFETSLVGQAVLEQRVVVTDDLALVDAVDAKKLLAAGIGSTLNVPFFSAGKPLGVVNFGHTKRGYFAESDVENAQGLIRLLASHVAVHEHVLREQRLAFVDELTGVLSRRAILRELTDAVADSAGHGAATLYVDLDGFKQINDTYGHAAGDKVLRQIAQRFEKSLRLNDSIGRLGGDEFLVVLEPGTSEEVLMAVANRLLDACADPIDLGLYEIRVRSSIGAAMTAADNTTATEMLVEADLAMYHAKRISTPIVMADEAISQRAGLISAIDRDVEAAMASGEIVFHYQPIRRLDDMELLGIEALLRWFHPVHGPVPPPLVVERIHTLGLMPAFTEWTLQTAAIDLLRIREAAPAFGDKSTSINLTARQLGWSGYLETHERALQQHGLRPIDLIIEVVESGVIEVGSAEEKTLHTLSERGSIIALDDFGTGHNVLGYFAQFPVNAIKFDRSLIEAMTTSERVKSIMRGLSQVAQELGIYTLAEGLERQDQVELSMELGIIKGQGYLLGRPMSLDALADLVNTEFEDAVGGQPPQLAARP